MAHCLRVKQWRSPPNLCLLKFLGRTRLSSVLTTSEERGFPWEGLRKSWESSEDTRRWSSVAAVWCKSIGVEESVGSEGRGPVIYIQDGVLERRLGPEEALNVVCPGRTLRDHEGHLRSWGEDPSAINLATVSRTSRFAFSISCPLTPHLPTSY